MPGTYVRLTSADRDKLEYVVFENGVGTKIPHEISRQEAESAELIGLRLGDMFVQNKGMWFAKSWTIETILPVDQYLANDIIANYGTRFPGADFFAVGFRLDTEHPGPADFQPMIASTHERQQSQQQILDLYQEQCLPLAFTAMFAIVTKAEVRRRRSVVHVLRHTFASLLIQQGESLTYVKEQMGHASIQVTADIYGHLVPGGNRSAVDRLDSATFRNPGATDAAGAIAASGVKPFCNEW